MPKLSEDRPIYIQLKEYIEDEILKRHIEADEQIPSTNELAAFFQINPVTVLKGIGLLADDGIIYKRRGVGMFVCQGACEKLQAKYKESFVIDGVLPLVQQAKSLDMTYKELQQIIYSVWEEENHG